MFGEKEKRKERPKNSDIDSKTIKLALISIILIIGGYLTLVILLTSTCPPDPEIISIADVQLTATALDEMWQDVTPTSQPLNSEQGQ